MTALFCVLAIGFEPTIAADQFGDALPKDARMRLGSLRYRTTDTPGEFALNDDGSMLAVASLDGSISLFDTKSGKSRTFVTNFDEDIIPQLLFSPDTMSLVVLTPTGQYQKWLVRTVERQPISRAVSGLRRLTFSKKGELLAVAVQTARGTPRDKQALIVRVFNLDRKKELGHFSSSLEKLGNLRLSDDGKLLIESQDRNVILRNVKDGSVISSYRVPTRNSQYPPCGFTTTNKPLAAIVLDSMSSNSKSRFRTANLATGKTLFESTHAAPMKCLGLSSNGRWLCISGGNRKDNQSNVLRVVDAETGAERMQIETEGYYASAIQFSADGNMLAIHPGFWASRSIELWNLRTKTRLNGQHGHKAPVKSLAFANSSKFLASASSDNSVRIWNVETGKQDVTLFDGHPNDVVAWSPDDQFLASSSVDAATIWDTQLRKPLYSVPVSLGVGCTSLSFSTNGKYFAIGSKSGQGGLAIAGRARVFETLDLWETRALKAVPFSSRRHNKVPPEFHNRGSLSKFRDAISTVAFAPNDKLLASAGWIEPNDGVISFWSVPDGKLVRRIDLKGSPVDHIAFSPDGKTLLSIETDDGRRRDTIPRNLRPKNPRRDIRLWNVADGSPKKKSLKGHTDLVTSAVYSPDGRFIASSSYDKTIRLWSVASGKVIKVLNGHRGAVFSVAFSPDGKLLASGSSDTSILIWKVP